MGLLDGKRVGLFEGTWVGMDERSREGAWVGNKLGELEGWLVGE